MDYAMGQRSLPGSGEGLNFFNDPTTLAMSAPPGANMASMNPLGPAPAVSSVYNIGAPALYGLSNAPQQTLDQIGPVDELSPFGNQKFFPGSFEADQMMMSGVNLVDQQLALPNNEFDQAQTAVTKAKKAANIIARGRDAVHHARNVKKAADVAKASQDVSGLLGNLGSMSGQAASTAAKEAGKSAFGTFLSSGAGAAASAGAGILGKAIQELDKKDGNFSNAGAMGGGALQGAALGSALGPAGTIVGGAIGAGVGLMQKSKFEANARAQKLTEEYNEIKKDTRRKLEGRQILNTFPVEGIKDQIYKYGGMAQPDYLAEGGEMIQHAPGDLPRTNQNGAVTPITQTIARITGDKHSAPSGGVGMTGEKPARIYSDQLHVPEDLMNQLSKL
tara:strand:+ start:1765 stop:2934 length:1170 start_codon:yes stop_codon:yes gene_type:complete